jgi:hypothetical protein
MDLTLLPKELEDVINNYRYQIEHIQKFANCLDAIEEIDYEIEYDEYHDVIRTIREDTHYFYFRGKFEIEQYRGQHQTITIIEGSKYEFEYW